MRYTTLKERQRRERDHYHDNLGLRIHRALSWLGKAETEAEAGDDDGAFVFLWIAFNAAYATDLSACPSYRDGNGGKLCESERFRQFVAKLVKLDDSQHLYELVWNGFSDNIRLLLDNPYLFQPFWEVHSGRAPARDWESEFRSANHTAKRALGNRDTCGVVSIILSRIYTLRNQIIHGGATFRSQVNRDQVRSATRFLQGFVPLIVTLMMDHPDTLWGDACYPVVDL